MKTISKLNDKLIPLFQDGELPEDVLERIRGTIPTLRQMLVRLAGGPKPKDGEESIWAFQVGMKLRSATDDSVDLEDADFNLLKNRAKDNAMGWNSWELGQIRLHLEECEKAKS